MKINKKVLSIPPYLSTSWDFVASLRLKGTDLIVQLKSGEPIAIPELKPDLLEEIFNFHASYMEDKEQLSARPGPVARLSQKLQTDQPALHNDLNEPLFKIGFGGPDGMNAALQHTPELAGSPDMPPEILEKISAISKIITPEGVTIPKPEPHCNCPFCQIARTIHTVLGTDVEEQKEDEEEEVSEEELQFQEWEITQSGDKLFTVVNKLDSHEKYSVYLGHPVGCTCGKAGCEHILAVLKS